ncbi:hypothetical protein GCM10009700_12220 [Brevibacterium sanguinis]
MAAGEHGDDAVGFTELVAREDDALITIVVHRTIIAERTVNRAEAARVARTPVPEAARVARTPVPEAARPNARGTAHHAPPTGLTSRSADGQSTS